MAKKNNTSTNEEEEKKKKKKLLLIIFGWIGAAAVVAGATVGIVFGVKACTNTNSKIELSSNVKEKGVSVVSENIQLGKDSTIELKIPDGKTIDDISIEIAGQRYTKGAGIKIQGNKITIPGDFVKDEKIIIQGIDLVDETPTKEVVDLDIVNPKTTWKKNETIKAENLTIKGKYSDGTFTDPLIWGTQYSISKDDNIIPNFDTTGYTFTATDVERGSALFKITYLAKSTVFKTFTVTVEDQPAVEDVIVSGEHNVDIEKTATHTFNAKDQNGNDITSECVWKTTDTTKQIAWFEDGSNTLKLGKAATTGASNIMVTATYSTSNGEIVSDNWRIEIASFEKLDKNKLAEHTCEQSSTASGAIVLPRYYYNGSTYIEQNNINYFALPGITSIYISKFIGENIVKECFGQGMVNITVDPENGIYTSKGKVDGTEKECNCMINKSTKELFKGCAGTIIPNDDSVTTIGENAFYNSSIEIIDIPTNITSIGKKAFCLCGSLNTFTFTETSNCSSIGEGCFESCTSLSSIMFPESITSIGKECFKENNEALTSAIFEGSNKWIQTDDDDKKQISTIDDSFNASCLNDCTTTGYTGKNWGTTGIIVNNEAIQIAKVQYDSTSFTTNKIHVNECTSEVVRGTVDDITIKLTADEEVSGEIIIKDSSLTEIARIKDVNLSPETPEDEYTINLEDEGLWESINPQDTLTLSFEKIIKKTATIYVKEEGTWKNYFEQFEITEGWYLIEGEEYITLEYTLKEGVESINGNLTVYKEGNPIYSEYAEMGGPGGSYTFYLDENAWSQITTGDTLYLDFIPE